MENKIIIDAKELSDRLTKIKGVIKTNNTLPILNNVLFVAKNNTILLMGSDLENTLQTKFSNELGEGVDISICIPYSAFAQAIKSIKGVVTLEIDVATSEIKINYENGGMSMIGYPSGDFPKAQKLKDHDDFVISSSVLNKTITKALKFVSNDELRPTMTGVLMEMDNKNVTFAATDAHKLIKIQDILTDNKVEKSIIISKNTLNVLGSILGAADDIIVEYNETNITFEIEEYKLMARLIDGKYPNYNAVIPKEFSKEALINKNDLLSTLGRVGLFANKTTNTISLDFNAGIVDIQGEDIDFSTKAKEQMFVQYEGEPIKIGFNRVLLEDVLKSFDGENILLLMSEPDKAGIIKKEDDNSQISLLMPVMLK